jgi:hypothetical protein
LWGVASTRCSQRASGSRSSTYSTNTFVGRQPGTSVGDELFAGVVLTGILVGALLLYPRLRGGPRALLAFCLGVLIATAGAMHLAHIVIDRAEGSDYTRVLAFVGGMLLIGLSIAVAWRSRRGGTLPRRLGRRALVALGLAAVTFFVLFPIGAAIYVTRTPREPIDGAFSVPHENVEFETADGLTIRGWYAPPGTGPPSCSSMVPEAAVWDRGNRPDSWRPRATACCSTTRVVVGRATATLRVSTGRGSRTSMLRSNT